MDFNEWLTAKGFDPSTLSEQGRVTLEATWRSENRVNDDDDEPIIKLTQAQNQPVPSKALNAIIEEQRKENARREGIEKLVAKALTANPVTVDVCEQIGQKAIDQHWTIQQTELELIRGVQSNGPGLSISRESDSRDISSKVLEAALCMGTGLENIDKHFDERTLDVAHKQFRNGIGLNDLIMISARQRGYRGQSYSVKSNMRTVMQYAMSPNDSTSFRAGPSGPSTYTLPQILSNVSNKFLFAGFTSTDQTWREFSAIRSANDFKQLTTLALTDDLQYKSVPRGGEIKHGSVAERYYNNQVNTYGILIGIDRRDIVNDDAGAFSTMSRYMGVGAADSLNDVFWTKFLNNSTFFASGNSNVSTGGGSALATADGAAINAAEQKFYAQTKPNGKPLGIMPKIMLVPPTLVNTAARWMGSQLMVGSSALGDANVYSGRYRVLTSAYMENSNYTGYSTAAWYLLAEPSSMAVIETAFLNGQQNPTVETGEFDWNTLGMSMRGYWDFGCELQEYRGGVRSAGS